MHEHIPFKTAVSVIIDLSYSTKTKKKKIKQKYRNDEQKKIENTLYVIRQNTKKKKTIFYMI